MKIKWAILGVSVTSFCIGMTVEDRWLRREDRKRKPLLVEAWSAIILRAKDENLTRDEAKALVKNVLSRVPYKFTVEDVSKIVDEEIEFLSIVR